MNLEINCSYLEGGVVNDVQLLSNKKITLLSGNQNKISTLLGATERLLAFDFSEYYSKYDKSVGVYVPEEFHQCDLQIDNKKLHYPLRNGDKVSATQFQNTRVIRYTGGNYIRVFECKNKDEIEGTLEDAIQSQESGVGTDYTKVSTGRQPAKLVRFLEMYNSVFDKVASVSEDNTHVVFNFNALGREETLIHTAKMVYMILSEMYFNPDTRFIVLIENLYVNMDFDMIQDFLKVINSFSNLDVMLMNLGNMFKLSLDSLKGTSSDISTELIH